MGIRKNSPQKNRKQSEAKIRQERYNSLSLEEKIKLAKSRRGNSSKELSRLEKLG